MYIWMSFYRSESRYIPFTMDSAYKFDKNSHVIMKPCNFASVMEKVCRIFLFLLPLLFYSTASSAHKLENFFDCTNSIEFSPFEENGKFGLKNTNGDVLIPAEYDYLGWSNNTFSVIENVTGYRLHDQWGLINL